MPAMDHTRFSGFAWLNSKRHGIVRLSLLGISAMVNGGYPGQWLSSTAAALDAALTSDTSRLLQHFAKMIEGS